VALTENEKGLIRGLYGPESAKMVEQAEAQGFEVSMAPGGIAVIQPKEASESITLVDLANAEKALRDAKTPRFEKGPSGVMTLIESPVDLQKAFYMGIDPGGRYEANIDVKRTMEQQRASVMSQLEAIGALLGPAVATSDGLDEAMGVKFEKPVVETSTLDFSARLDEIVSDAARELLPPGIASQAVGLLKRQLAMLWLGINPDKAVTFERLSVTRNEVRVGGDSRAPDLEERELDMVGERPNQTRVSMLLADRDPRTDRMAKLREMAKYFSTRKYTVMFIEEE
jgi:hypothetical protein